MKDKLYNMWKNTFHTFEKKITNIYIFLQIAEPCLYYTIQLRPFKAQSVKDILLYYIRQ